MEMLYYTHSIYALWLWTTLDN